MQIEYQSLVAINPVTLIAQICNLFIQLFLVKKFFLDKIKAILDQRRLAADQQITEAEAAKAAAKKEYDARRGIVDEETEEETALSGIPERPYCKGRNYDPNRYNSN